MREILRIIGNCAKIAIGLLVIILAVICQSMMVSVPDRVGVVLPGFSFAPLVGVALGFLVFSTLRRR